jgi:ABC-type sugar transport system permease subunit
VEKEWETRFPATERSGEAGARRPEIDWLRVGAIFLVFVVHSAQIFSPIESWHIDSPESSRLLGQFTVFLGPWIMPLFMLLAGASAWYARRRRSDREYLQVRVARLLVPLVAGTLLVVPPQVYYRRLFRGEFEGTFLAFYPSFFDGVFPEGNLSYGHLWFIAYLFLYMLAGVVVFRATYFSPVVVVMAVAATIWLLLYNPDRGLINGFLRLVSFGTLESDWLRSTTMALPAIMIMSMWQGVGFQMIIILAGLQDIPGDLYEAAQVDGATRWEQFRFITLPQLRNTLIFVATVTMILAFRLFDQVWVMTRGGPLGATRTMMLEMVEVGFERQQIARGSAIAVIFFVIVLSVTVVQRVLLKEEAS